MSKQQLKVQCLKKRDKWIEQNHQFSFQHHYMPLNEKRCLPDLCKTRIGPGRAEILAHPQILPPAPISWQQTHRLRQHQNKSPGTSGSCPAKQGLLCNTQSSHEIIFFSLHLQTPRTNSVQGMQSSHSLCHTYCSYSLIPVWLTLFTKERLHQSSEFGKLFNGKLMV